MRIYLYIYMCVCVYACMYPSNWDAKIKIATLFKTVLRERKKANKEREHINEGRKKEGRPAGRKEGRNCLRQQRSPLLPPL